MSSTESASDPVLPDRPYSPHELLRQTRAAYPDNAAFVVPSRLEEDWQVEGGAWTYRQFCNRIDELIADFRASDIAGSPGDTTRVALLLGNQPDFYAHWLALNALGISIVPINPDYQPEEIRHLFDASGARLAIVRAEVKEQIRQGAQSAAHPIEIVSHRSPLPVLRRAIEHAGTEAVSRDAEAALLFTSGTMSLPKACVLSNDYFLYWGQRYAREGGLISLQPGVERLLQPLPTFHINALANAFMAMLTIGGCLVPLDRFHPRTWWQEAMETKATCFHYLGVIPALLLSLPKQEGERDHQMRFGMGGGVDPAQHKAFEDRFGVPLCEGWAMTEAGATALMMDGAPPRAVGQRCIGRPRPHQETRLVDEAGQVVTGEGQGELQLRHAGDNPRKGFFSGYLNDEEATAAVWQDGWFRTGDVVRRDDTGRFFFAERRKNIIRRSGENITPGEVETVLRRDRDVRNVVVVAAPDPVREEEVAAIIEAEPNATAADLAERLFVACRENLAYYKAPGLIVLVEAIPLTATQKIRRQDLQDLIDGTSTDRKFDFRDRKRRKRRE